MTKFQWTFLGLSFLMVGLLIGDHYRPFLNPLSWGIALLLGLQYFDILLIDLSGESHGQEFLVEKPVTYLKPGKWYWIVAGEEPVEVK